MIPQAVKDLVEEFVKLGYFDDMTFENFKLHAADNGGYDIADNVTLEFIDDKVFMIFRKDDSDYRPYEVARFELKFQ